MAAKPKAKAGNYFPAPPGSRSGSPSTANRSTAKKFVFESGRPLGPGAGSGGVVPLNAKGREQTKSSYNSPNGQQPVKAAKLEMAVPKAKPKAKPQQGPKLPTGIGRGKKADGQKKNPAKPKLPSSL